jgi:hypothetical protein
MQRVPGHLVISPRDVALGLCRYGGAGQARHRSNHPGAVFLGFTRFAGYLRAQSTWASEAARLYP